MHSRLGSPCLRAAGVCFGAEVDTRVGAVAKGLVARATASAKPRVFDARHRPAGP